MGLGGQLWFAASRSALQSATAALVLAGATSVHNGCWAASPVAQSVAMNGSGDVADQAVVWIHPHAPGQSVLLGVNKSLRKSGGLYAFDLDGNRYGKQPEWNSTNWFTQGARINSVDIRYGFGAGNERWDIVAISNRSKGLIELFRVVQSPAGDFAGLVEVGKIDTAVLGNSRGVLGKATDVLNQASHAIQNTSHEHPYGLAFFQPRRAGKHFVVANSTRGNAAQWELVFDEQSGEIKGQKVWHGDLTPGLDSEVEGVVADDEQEVVYLAAEDFAIYRYKTTEGIIQDEGRVTVDCVGQGRLEADIEGLAIHYGIRGQGYLVASSQGSNNFHAYNRSFVGSEPNAHEGSFQIAAGNGIDEVSATDGISIVSSNLGGLFSAGLLIAHDGEGASPTNYKLVPWESIAQQLNSNAGGKATWNPRSAGEVVSHWAADVKLNPLNPFPITASTGDKPQSKVWHHAGEWWCIMPDSTGTWLRKLEGYRWHSVMLISPNTWPAADVLVAGPLVHALLFAGRDSQLVSLVYVQAAGSYEPWSRRTSATQLVLPSSAETATLAQDSNGRLWIATENKSISTSPVIQVYYSEGVFDSFSAPITIGSGVSADDIGAIASFPDGSVGVLWSDQVRRCFQFRLHAADDPPQKWSSVERAAGDTTSPVGAGVADDHINFAVGSDGTLYAAVKTGYDTDGKTEIGLLVRRPTGSWDNLHHISFVGTRPSLLLDESVGRLLVAYTNSHGNVGDIVIRESPLDPIAFSQPYLVMSGTLNNVTTTKQHANGQVLLLASDFPSTGISAAYGALLSYDPMRRNSTAGAPLHVAPQRSHDRPPPKKTATGSSAATKPTSGKAANTRPLSSRH